MDPLLPFISSIGSYSLPGFGFGSGFGFFLSLFLFLAVFSFWLTPGGLAWAVYNTRTHFVTRTGSSNRVSIPGPSGLPVLGLLLAFTGNSPTHRTLTRLARSYGAGSGSRSLMAFSVGLTRFIVSSDPGTARELLNSSDFADRPIKESAYELLFHRAMGFAPYGDYWRTLRRISAVHLFSPRRIQRLSGSRRSMGEKMIRDVKALMETRGEVKIKDVLHFTSLNNVMTVVFGKSYDFSPERSTEGYELENLVREGYDLLGIFNWSDHFPGLNRFDLQGVRRRCRDLVAKVDVFVRNIIEERRRGKNGNDQESYEEEEFGDDFADVLLGLQEENKLSDSDVVAVLWEMIFRGTDTVAILLEWILARMVLHPSIQAKAQAEMDAVVRTTTASGGLISRPVADSDLLSLPYLKAIVKESLRMHPPGPLLSWARLSTNDTWLGPYFVPAGTTSIVNMWAITHDHDIWPEPHVFRPERFLEGQGKSEDVLVSSVMGSDLRLAPFGSGRRVCPGKTLGLATVELWLAQLLQGFKWEACADHVDLTETLKLSMEMKKPLVCKAIPRERL